MHYRHLSTSLKLACVVVSLTAIGASQVHALDRKIYAAVQCVRDYLSGGNPIYVSGAVCNVSDYTLDVACPVIHDAIGPYGSTTYNITSGWLRVFDRNFNSDISCYLHNLWFPGAGAAGFSIPTQSSSGGNINVPQVLALGNVPTNVGLNENGHYYYGCRIPPRFQGYDSCITSYQITEGGTTGE